MHKILPQQRLLLEQLTMSGRIGVMDPRNDTILWRTIRECHAKGWIRLIAVSFEVSSVEITANGRKTLAGSPWIAPPDHAAQESYLT